MNRLQHVHLEDVKPFELAPGATGRPLFGESAMANLVELEPGSVFPCTATRTSSSASCCSASRCSRSTASSIRWGRWTDT